MSNRRVCGGCTACCFTCEIEAIRKPVASQCQFCSQSGCGIYESRPKECRDFKCQWLLGFGGKEHRPDKIGAVISYSKNALENGTLAIFEARAGALQTNLIKQITATIVQKGISVIYVYLSGRSELFLGQGVVVTPAVQEIMVKEGFVPTVFSE